jgi:hypothetical protein
MRKTEMESTSKAHCKYLRSCVPVSGMLKAIQSCIAALKQFKGTRRVEFRGSIMCQLRPADELNFKA